MEKYSDEIKVTLRTIENQLELAEERLNYTIDELLIDSIIFEMESLYKRHSYYFRVLKELKSMEGESVAV